MATDQVDAPPLLQHLPTAKEKKYDRQLRLWAASGQAALEDAHILLVNAGPGVTGIEALKNLVLPGIGQFTIQDSNIVTEADLGVNFFLDRSSLGKSRAEQACKMLLELNPDVRGHHVSEPVTSWISDQSLQPYTLILVASPVHPDVLAALSSHAQRTGIALFYYHSVGFYSQFSILLPLAFPIVDTHPDPASTTDLRLLTPWPELQDFVASKTAGLDQMTGFELSHVPYVALLIHYLDQWRASHNGQAPLSYKDKTAFREFVRDSGPPGEENYAEAVAAVLKTINAPSLPSAVVQVLSAPETTSLGPDSASFWYIAAAIHAFHQQHAQLPLPGSLPDMKAQSADYIALQNIYKAKSRADTAEVAATVSRLTAQHGRTLPVPPAEIDQFCKLAAHVHLVRGSPAALRLASDPLAWPASAAKSLVAALPNPELGLDSTAPLLLAFAALDAFLASHVDAHNSGLRAPGSGPDVGRDAEKMRGIAWAALDAAIDAAGTRVEEPRYGAVRAAVGDVCAELARAGGAELHNVAALTGGMLAQEIIKVVTRQYVPADNVVVFDGIASRTGVYRI